jgi:predicted metalloprotease
MTTNQYAKGQAVTVDFTGLGHVVACEYVKAHAQGGHVVKVMGKNVRVFKVTA